MLATKILIATPTMRSLIHKDKTHQIYSIIQTSRKLGMRTMNAFLSDLYRANMITYDEALARSGDPAELERLIRSV